MSCILESVHLQSPCAIERKKTKTEKSTSLCAINRVHLHLLVSIVYLISSPLSVFLESRIWFKLNEEIIFQFEALSLTVCRRLQFLEDIGE